MAENIGKLITCDRCHESVFLKYTDTKHLDGGFTKVEQFESKPKGWRNVYELHMDLCPKCSTAFNNLLEEFKESGDALYQDVPRNY